MRIEAYHNYSEDKTGLINICKLIISRFEQMDLFITVIDDLYPQILDEYLNAIVLRLRSEIKIKYIEYEEILETVDFSRFKTISSSKKLVKTLLEYIAQVLEVTELRNNETEIRYFLQMASRIGLNYHRTKTFTDIFGQEEGVSMYKHVIHEFVRRHYSSDSYHQETNLDNHRKNMINTLSNQGLADFTVGIIDDYQNIYRIDRCMEYEILKIFNDPDIAYLSQCYIADIPEFNKERVIRVRRTQTLNHSSFCDELYWNNNKAPNAKHPDIDLIGLMKPEDV